MGFIGFIEFIGFIGLILGIYWDHGKESGSYYLIMVYTRGVI